MPALNTAARNLALTLIKPDLDAGTIAFYTGASPGPNNAPTGTLLGALSLGSPAFGAPAAGVMTANAISNGVGVANGTAGYMRVSGTTIIADFTVSIVGGGGEAQLPSLAITVGEVLACSSFTWTQPT